MFKDYSGSVMVLAGRNRARSSRRRPVAARNLFPATRFMRKTISVMLLATLFIGIGSTIWYGLQVQVALDQIGGHKAVNNTLHHENKLLVAQRNLMLSRDHMEETGNRLGLRFPDKNQLRYP